MCPSGKPRDVDGRPSRPPASTGRGERVDDQEHDAASRRACPDAQLRPAVRQQLDDHRRPAGPQNTVLVRAAFVDARAEGAVEWTSALADLNPVQVPMVWALTPYGDTVFNQRRVQLLTSELDRLPAACGGDWVARTRELCQVVERGTHLYLWFVGD